MKRGLIILTILVILFLNIPNINASPADLNSDNKVNATDIQLIIRWILGIDQTNPATDMDGNGQVNIFDLVNASRLFGKIYGSDSIAPTIISSSPSSNLSSGVTSTILFAKTDERATCKYLNSSSGNFTVNMTTFTRTGGVSHSTTLTGLANGTLYNYYIQCQDEAGNLNSTNYNISFGVNGSRWNEPTGLTRFMEMNFSTWPTGDGAVTGELDGVAYSWSQNPRSLTAVDSLVDPAQVSPPKVLKYIHANGTMPGYTSADGYASFSAWDLDGLLSNTEYSEFYERTTVNFYGNGTTYETPGGPGFKGLAYWGVTDNNQNPATGSGPTQIYNVLRPVSTIATTPLTASEFYVDMYTQNGGAQNFYQNQNTSKHVVVGQWHTFETYMKLNDAGSANGVWRWWLDGVLVGEYTNVSFIDSSFPAYSSGGLSGFFGRTYNAVWGGSGGANKSRDDYILIDHMYFSGKWLRDKA